ncbi:MAG: 2-oxo acid dehydrogenase subunit E2, partial [Gemmatimonadales bacterium]
MFENIFETVNSGFAQALYEEYLKDPASVPAEWRALFEAGLEGEVPIPTSTDDPVFPPSRRPAVPSSTSPAAKPSGDPALPLAFGSRRAESLSSQARLRVPAFRPSHQAAQPITGPALRLLQNMEASLDLPTATSFRDIDVSTLWSYRSALNSQLSSRGTKLSFTHLIGWAIVQAVEDYPSMVNAVREVDGEPHKFTPGAVNLGLAVDVERKDGRRGLMVPIITNAHEMTFAEFHAEYERLVDGARNNKLLPDSYVGGTITLTNPGTIGTVASVPRLMKGQGSIIATGAIRTTHDARIMTMTSTYDHRIIQGAESGMFLQLVDKLLQGERDFYDTIAYSMEVQLGIVKVERPSLTAAPVATLAASQQLKAGDAVSAEMLYHVAAAMSLVKNHRTHGHRAARLDPLGSPPPGDPALDPDRLGLTPEIMAQIPSKVVRTYVAGETLAEAYPNLRATYCGTMAYEIEHIDDHEERVWLRQVIESGKHRHLLSESEKKRLLADLTKTDGLERFLHRAYLGHKRFGIEGLDALVPMLRHTVELASADGAHDVVIGMAHRGRLNVLTHVVGVPYETLLAEFEGGLHVEETLAPKGGTGDVKYHHGAVGDFETADGKPVCVCIMPNPSHLEAVDPVVEGRTRAAQTDRTTPEAPRDTDSVVPILIHGDAAFAAQGVVAETFNLSRLEGYGTGGTIHIITNNQVGFTTDWHDARSTQNASALALGFDVPIIHANADDPEACIAAVRLAMMYRAKFRAGCVINLV